MKNNANKQFDIFLYNLKKAMTEENARNEKGVYLGLSPANKLLYEAEVARISKASNSLNNEHNRRNPKR